MNVRPGYRLDKHVGRGSFGDVYEATLPGARGLGRRLIVKRTADELASVPGFLESFVAAGRRALGLADPRVAQVVEVNDELIAMEHVPGASLASLLEERAQGGIEIPLGMAIGIAAEVALALEHAHRRGILHGDLCPPNVLLSLDGAVKVSDFCLAEALFSTLPDAPALVGKWAYASPERARGAQVVPQSDLFSLGTLLFELVTGENPFARPNVERTRRALGTLVAAPTPAAQDGALSADLARVVLALLSPDPEARPPSGARVHEALLSVLYATGERFDPSALASVVRQLTREPPPPEPSLSGLLRSYSEQPPPPEIEVRWETAGARESVPPPWSESGARRDVTVIAIAADPALGESALAQVESTLGRHGAQLLELSSSAITAVFGLADADGRDTENAARAGRAVLRFFQHATSHVSAGIVSARIRVTPEGGPADRAELGPPLEAARARAGRRGWLVADERCARQLHRAFELEPVSDGWVVEEPYAEPLGQFVGRKEQLRRIGDELSRAHAGHLRVIGLVGPAGVGKTRFLNELCRRLQATGSPVGHVVATCPARGRVAPLSALDAMLRALCGIDEGDIIANLHDVEARLRALGLSEFDVTSILLQLGAGGSERDLPSGAPLDGVLVRIWRSLSRDRLQLLAWDNAQELDETSAKLLGSALEELSAARMAFLLAGRPDEHAAFRHLPGYSEIVLEDFDPKESRQLVERRLGVDRMPDRVFNFFHERAGGHPMFLEELVHEALDSGALNVRHRYVESAELDSLAVPRTLHSLLSDRVARLPEPEKNLLVAASVLGEPVDELVLGEMTELDAESTTALVERLERRDVFSRNARGGLCFTSRMLPEVLLAGLAPDVLRRVHRSAANALLAVGGDADEDAARVAEHLNRSGDANAAARHYARSGLALLRARRFERAADDLARALWSCDSAVAEPGEISIWVSALAQASSRIPHRPAVVDAVRRALRELDVSALRFEIARILADMDQDAEARSLLVELAEAADSSADVRRAALTTLAELALRRGEFAEALTEVERASELGSGGAREQHRVLLTRAQALASSDHFDEALEALERAAAIAPADDPALACQRARTRAVVCGFRGDWAGCADASEEAAEQGRQAGLVREVAANLHNLGEASIRMNDLARGYAALQASLSLAEEARLERIANFDRLLLAYLDAIDDLPRADEIFEERLRRAEERGWTLDRMTGRFLLGKLLARRGDRERARRELESVRELALSVENRPLSRDCEIELAELD